MVSTDTSITSDRVVSLAGISKHFPGVQALRDVNLDLAAGEIHALVGANGAGKSTLIHILSGAISTDSGRISVDGIEIESPSPNRMRELGIRTIYQERTVVPELSVGENIYAGDLPRTGLGRVDWNSVRDGSRDVLKRLGVEIDSSTRTAELGAAQQQLVEIARAIRERPRVLVLDEPTAALGSSEAKLLFSVIGSLQREGVALLFISHHLDEVFEISQKVTVLRDGATVSSGDTADFTHDRLVSDIAGRTLQARRYRGTSPRGKTLLSCVGVSAGPRVQEATLSVRGGEVVVLTGMVGSGRTETLEAIVGLRALESGEISLTDNVSYVPAGPGHAIRKGIVYLPEERQSSGIVPEVSIAGNISMSVLSRLSSWMGISRRRERAVTTDKIEELGIKTASPDTPIRLLSGGNQQKAILARLLLRDADLLLLDEPTKGVDVGAKAEIYHIVRAAAERGTGVLMVSSDIEEVLSIADRVLVMRRGRIVVELDGNHTNEEEIIRFAVSEK